MAENDVKRWPTVYGSLPTGIQNPESGGPRYDDDEDDGEAVPLLATSAIKIYSRRWYLLLLFALVGFTQNMVWNTWGPITDSVKVVFDWSNADIATFANVGNVLFVIMAFPASWMLDVLGEFNRLTNRPTE